MSDNAQVVPVREGVDAQGIERRIRSARTEVLRCVFPAFDDHTSITQEYAESCLDAYAEALALRAQPAPGVEVTECAICAKGGHREGEPTARAQ